MVNFGKCAEFQTLCAQVIEGSEWVSGRGKSQLALYGRFRFVGPDGCDLAPKSAKSQTLIALLATSEKGGRGRLWLQKRLWPSSGSDKAAVSLRQSLSEVRRALGEERDLLFADRRSVSLDLDRIDLVEPAQDEEFLEGVGMSGADHGLPEWFERQRQRRAAPRRKQRC